MPEGSNCCEETYGFLPCSTSLGGSLTLMVFYGYILLQGANLISAGSELLLEILDPGLIGGLVLPILGALPDAAIIVISGSKASLEEVSVGVGTLAGSTTLLLTLVWGGSACLGRCDLDAHNESINKSLTNPFSLHRTGVTCDNGTMRNALIMILTAIPMVVVQVSASAFERTNVKAQDVIVLLGTILCFTSLVLYLAYQLISPELLKSKIRAIRSKVLRQHSLAMFSKTLESMGQTGKVTHESLSELFEVLDKDNNGFLDKREAFVALTTVGTSLLTLTAELSMADAEYILKALDSNKDGMISREEFVDGLMKWIDERRHDFKLMRKAARKASLKKYSMDIGVKDLQDSPLLDEMESQGLLSIEEGEETDDDDSDEESDDGEDNENNMTHAQIATKSSALLLIGALVVAIFSDPMVDAVSNFSTSSGIPAFFVAFIVTPLASNSSEAVSSLQFASRKKRKNFNLTYSQIYGAVAMNNTMCLGLFYMVMFKNKMAWIYASETASMLLVVLVVGFISMSNKTIKTGMGIFSILLYPVSVALIYVLDHALGWQ